MADNAYLRRRRGKLFNEQGGKCYHCGGSMVLAKGRADGRCEPDDATLDHLLPVSRGGTIGNGNTVAACFRCNQDRGDGNPVNTPIRARPQAVVVWRDD